MEIENVRYVEFQEFHETIQQLLSEINSLRSSVAKSYRFVSDEQAKREIVNFVKELRRQGRNSTSDVEVVESLNLPLEQVSVALSSLFDVK